MVVVHPGSAPQAAALVAEFPGSEACHWVSDPEGLLYDAFGLGRAGLLTAVSAGVWKAGFRAFRRGHRPNGFIGDPARLSGTFVLAGDRILSAHRHTAPGETDDFMAMVHGTARGPHTAH